MLHKHQHNAHLVQFLGTQICMVLTCAGTAGQCEQLLGAGTGRRLALLVQL